MPYRPYTHVAVDFVVRLRTKPKTKTTRATSNTNNKGNMKNSSAPHAPWVCFFVNLLLFRCFLVVVVVVVVVAVVLILGLVLVGVLVGGPCWGSFLVFASSLSVTGCCRFVWLH